MALPSYSDLKLWVGTLFTQTDWDFNFKKIVDWLSNGTSDIVVSTLTAENGIDMNSAKITNLAPAENGTDAVSLDTAQTLLNRTSYYYPFSVASGKIDTSTGKSAFLQKISDTSVKILAGSTNPDLVVIQSDGTVETLSTDTTLAVPTSDDAYYIIKEKGETPVLTSGDLTIGITFPATQAAGDYFLDNSSVPFMGYKYDSVDGWVETPFSYLGSVVVASQVATVTTRPYNQNFFDVNYQGGYLFPDLTSGVSKAWATSHTAEESGWLYCYVGAQSTGVATQVSVNDVVVARSWIGPNTSVNSSTWFPIFKGDTYIGTGSFGGQETPFIKFYSMKGAS